MQILTSAADLRAWRRSRSGVVGFVPTMGALHAGHLSLVDCARRHADHVVASVFVNPTQFDDPADLAAYPRRLEQDAASLEAAGVEALYAPSVADMYGALDRSRATVQPPALASELEGAHRPGHFVGVATVVVKLLNRVMPTLAVFGEKDFQQLKVVEAVVRDLDLPVTIVGAPVVREPSGLAMSSRNARLSADQRRQAAQLYRELAGLRDTLQARSVAAPKEIAAACAATAAALTRHAFDVDYVDVRRADDFSPLARNAEDRAVETAAAAADGGIPDRADATGAPIAAVIVAAARLGPVRLLDAVRVDVVLRAADAHDA